MLEKIGLSKMKKILLFNNLIGLFLQKLFNSSFFSEINKLFFY